MHLPESSFESMPNSFAIVRIGGHQVKVTMGDEIMIDQIDVPILSTLLLDKVLLVGDMCVG